MISETDLAELQDEDRNQDYSDWLLDHLTGLQIDFMDKHSDLGILDDDLPDFFDDRVDEFDAYCKKRYGEEI